MNILAFGQKTLVLFVAVMVMMPVSAAPDPVCEDPDQSLEVLNRAVPAYPRTAALYCIEGRVSVELTVGPTGQVKAMEVLTSEPPEVFNQSAEMLKEWQFLPACEDGEPVVQKATTSVDFVMDSAERDHCVEKLSPDYEELLIQLFVTEQLMAEALSTSPPDEDYILELIGNVSSGQSGDARTIAKAHEEYNRHGFEMMSAFLAGWEAEEVRRLFDGDPGSNPDDVATLERDIVDARSFLEEFQATNESFLEQADRRLEELDGQVSLSPEEYALMIEGPRLGLQEHLAQLVSHVGVLKEIVDLHESILDLMKEHEGQWRGQPLVFEQDDVQREYDRLMDQMDTDLAQLRQMQRESEAYELGRL